MGSWKRKFKVKSFYFIKKKLNFFSRDFAYVAKDKDNAIRIYKCHVFRCDNTSARTIANTLRDICRNLMIERGLLTENYFPESMNNEKTVVSFPTPMEEPTNDLPCTYLGCVYVEKPGGMEILRPAIEKVAKTVPEEKWLKVFVNISPSSFTISSDNVNYLILKLNIYL